MEQEDESDGMRNQVRISCTDREVTVLFPDAMGMRVAH